MRAGRILGVALGRDGTVVADRRDHGDRGEADRRQVRVDPEAIDVTRALRCGQCGRTDQEQRCGCRDDSHERKWRALEDLNPQPSDP